MRVLSPSVLLNAWDDAAAQSPAARAITLLSAYWPDRAPEEWFAMSIGDRDRALLRMREELFGPRMEAAVSCPACGERLELAFTAADVSAPALPTPSAGWRLTVDGYDIAYRLPATADVLAIGSGGPSELLARCMEARRGGALVPAAELPEPVMRAISEAMAKSDPQADTQIALSCPACSHRWGVLFDALSFLWSEIEDWAARTLREVHALASAYGWTEREVLSLSARRRRMYLELVGC